MTLPDSLQSMGKKHVHALELERLQQWRLSMEKAWLDRPKDVYKWIKKYYQAPLVMLTAKRPAGPRPMWTACMNPGTRSCVCMLTPQGLTQIFLCPRWLSLIT